MSVSAQFYLFLLIFMRIKNKYDASICIHMNKKRENLHNKICVPDIKPALFKLKTLSQTSFTGVDV